MGQMGQPVIYFEVIGKDTEKLHSYYSELFGWDFDTTLPGYGYVAHEGNGNGNGVSGISGGVGGPPTPDYEGHVTFYVEVPDVEAALAQAEDLGGSRLFGPAPVPGAPLVFGQFADPEGHMIGLTQAQ